ncbi:MAG: hypothetical protein ABEL76_11215, partial [Bradymonadaceae bacterium]
MSVFLCAAVAAAAVSFGSMQSAEACSPAPCQGGFLVPAKGTVPANAPAFVWQPRSWGQSRKPKVSDVEIFQKGASANVPVKLTKLSKKWPNSYLIELESSLHPNATYRFRTASLCQRTKKPLETTFEAMGSASIVRAAQVSVSASLPASLKPWSNLLLYRTFIVKPNGKTKEWEPRNSAVQVLPPGESWKGRGEDLLYTVCQSGGGPPAGRGLTPGTYEVFMKASLPGANVTYESPKKQVTVRCNPGTADAGPGDAGAADTGVADVGPPDAVADAGPAVDVGSDIGGSSDTGGGDDAGPGVDTAGGQDAAAADGGSDDDVGSGGGGAPERSGSSGCSAAGTGGGGPAVPWGIVVV